MELVSGATGYVGGRLIERLLSQGRPVRALARDPSPLTPGPGLETVQANLVSGAGLDAAFDGASTAYYLVHSLEPDPDGAQGFAIRDRRAAENFAEAARKSGVKRLVYLGGLVPTGRQPSAHLASRLAVEKTLLSAIEGATALRASIIVGARSPSFRLLVRLIERMTILVLPAWRRYRTAPIDERDVIEYLALTPQIAETAGRSLDIVGPDVLSYRHMIERIAELMGVRRREVVLDVSLTQAASAVASAVSNLPLELVRPLMEGLDGDLLPRNDEVRGMYGLRLRPFERAVDHALGEWEALEDLAAR